MTVLRNFIAALDERGKLKRVNTEVNWKYEIGEIVRDIEMPLLFENIKDYPNKQLFANGLADYSSFALAIGIQDKKVRFIDLVKTLRRSFAAPIDPILIDDSPVKENCITQDIDLAVLPVPWWSDKDAGRYIGTWHINVSRDPETGSRNVGVYRMQILALNQTTVSVSPRSHLALQIRKAEKKDESLPMAVAIGVDERLVISAASAPPYGTDEYSLAGGLAGKPIELIRCMTQPLEVPADSEIVIEGFITPGIRVQDGPFLDYAGIPNTNPNAHIFEVTALLFRNDFIFRGTAVGRPGAEDHILYSVLSSLGLADFHGSRIRHAIQNFLLRRHAFKIFQLTGRIGKLARRSKSELLSEKK
jgi:4-hydroxy-3-polyprenylbenzoate decarboxylase